jgi:translation initiation factor IF-2
VAGCRIASGELEKKLKYRLNREGKIVQENLKIRSMKKIQLDVTSLTKGDECGLSFENFEGDLIQGDLIECYKESDVKMTKFNRKYGIF